MNFNAGFFADALGDPACQKEAVMQVQPMRGPVPQQGVDAGIEEEDLQSAPCGGVPALVGLQHLV